MPNMVEVKIKFDLDTLSIPQMGHPENLRLTQAILNEALHMLKLRRIKEELEQLQVKKSGSKIIPFQGPLPPAES